MRLEKQPDGSVREINNLHICSGCGEPFERGLFVLGWTNCGCTDRGGHRLATCLRGTCRATSYDPRCTATEAHHPLEGHAR